MDAEEMLVTAAGCHNGRIYIVVQKKTCIYTFPKGKKIDAKQQNFMKPMT